MPWLNRTIMQLNLEAKCQFELRFRIISLLGKGSFGYVYECQDLQNKQIYAVKVIAKANVKKSKIECLREEAKILSAIQHPNIVKVYEFGEAQTLIFLKMQILKNGTLDQLIQRRFQNNQKFTDDEVAEIMGSLLKGVNHIHAVSIIHRDIKPQNILMSNEGTLKIADFGLSTKLDFHYPKTATSKCGTMLFMAPEILNNYTYTKAVDVWACAIIMFMLSTGKHPFYQSKMTTQDYKKKIKIAKFPNLSNKLAQDFITRISKIEINERYSTQQALKHPWLTRNFQDQIPLSLHQSFVGFQKSHEVSHIIKILLAIKQLARPPLKASIPPSYLAKKDAQVQEHYSKRNKVSTREIHSLTDLTIVEKHTIKAKPMLDVENENPTIRKLNTIFNSLFGRRQKPIAKTEGLLPKENYSKMPDIAAYKERIEIEIQKAVMEFKGKEDKKKRILPHRAIAQLMMNASKEECKIETKCNYKMRFRKKNIIKLFQ